MRRREEMGNEFEKWKDPPRKKRLVDKKQQHHLTPNTMMRKLGSFDLFILGLHFPPRSRTCDRYSPSAQSGKRFL